MFQAQRNARSETILKHMIYLPCHKMTISQDTSSLTANLNRKGHEVPEKMKKARGSAVVWMENDVIKPNHAEMAKSLLKQTFNGFLSTIHHRSGYPYGSVISIAMNDIGQPFTLISTLAEHTMNIQADNRCSILVQEKQGKGDNLALARMTLVGHLLKVEKKKELCKIFLANHPAAYYVEFNDFHFYQLDIKEIRFIKGFGSMSWVDSRAFYEAEVDYVANNSSFAVSHMNNDHSSDVLKMTQILGGLPKAKSATILSLDRYGFDVLAIMPDGKRRTRIGFEKRLSDPEEIREAIVLLSKKAREIIESK